MPSRTSLTPWRYPERFSLFFRFPEYEIQRVFLLVFSGHLQRTEAGLQIFQILVRQLAVFLKVFHPEINGSVNFIGKALVYECLNHFNHTLDFLGSQGMCRGWFDIHIRHIFFALFNITCGNLLRTYAFFDSFCNDFIVHVCKIGNVVHVIALVFHITAHRVKYNHRSCISNVDKVVNRRSADIHAYFSLL